MFLYEFGKPLFDSAEVLAPDNSFSSATLSPQECSTQSISTQALFPFAYCVIP